MASVTRSRSTARSAHRASVEQDVFDAVERLLAAGESFTALGVQRIAEEAGIARTTFYGHFPDKATLLTRATEAVTETLFARATAWVQDDESTEEQLADTVLELVREHRRHAPLLRAVAEVAGYEPEVEAFWRGRIEAWADGLRRRLERDRRAGRTAADLDAATTALWIAWGTERTIAMHVASRAPRADRPFAAGVAAATWATMRRTGG